MGVGENRGIWGGASGNGEPRKEKANPGGGSEIRPRARCIVSYEERAGAVPLEYLAEVGNCAVGVCRVNFAP
jgi:hypothetical protein